MSNALSWGKIAAGLIATAAAIVGWSVVILQGTWLDDLERKLAEARQEHAVATSARPQSSKSAPMVQEQPPALEIQRDEAMGRIEQPQTELDAKTAELASVRSKIDHSVAQLEQLEAAVHRHRGCCSRVQPGSTAPPRVREYVPVQAPRRKRSPSCHRGEPSRSSRSSKTGPGIGSAAWAIFSTSYWSRRRKNDRAATARPVPVQD